MSSLTMAIGDSGRLEPTSEHDAVSVPALSAAANGLVLPATIRWLDRVKGRSSAALRLLRVERAGKRRPFVTVQVTCAPFVRYQADTGPVLGDFWFCNVRNAADVDDPIFDNLTAREKARIQRALASGKMR